ncbi:hypothetical protein ACFCV3_00785 [Kribbella sp. NPDC056345]|uniref:hypothetical protein n=1 Tax=Kribbella sp. NPDC056345 TaxID=3345789 RepID=UPI0035D80624
MGTGVLSAPASDRAWLIGQRVIAGTGGVGEYRGGGYAEQSAVPASEVFPVPDGLDVATAPAARRSGASSRGGRSSCSRPEASHRPSA